MNDVPDKNAAPSRVNVHRMFNRIAPRYDLLNHLLSANRDRMWRERVAKLLPAGSCLSVLDLATGTADQLLALFESGRVTTGIGLDPAEQMLDLGNEKIKARNLEHCLSLVVGQCEQLPFNENTFDAVSISFGIRNVTDVKRALYEMRRVLKPGGRALILEFSLPDNRVARRAYLVYFRQILPRLGAIISGDATAYRYLNRTVETFPHGGEFSDLMTDAGFVDVAAVPLSGGIVSIYRGDKR